MPLSRPPAISTIGGSNARSAAMTASGWVPCESLMNRTPSMTATGSSRCSTPVKAAAAAPDRRRREPERERDGDRGQRVRDVVGARDGELGDRHDPAARRRRGALVPPRASASRATPSATIQPSTTPEPARLRAGRADTRGPRRRPARRSPATTGSSALRTSAPGRVDQLGQPALDPAVALQRPVPVEVVGGDVGVDGDRRAARQRRQLELGQLVDDAVRRRSARAAARRSGSRCSRRGRPGAPGPRRGSPRSATTSWSCPSCRSRRSSARGTAAGTGPPRRRAPAPSGRRRRGRDERPQRGAQARLGRREVGR